MKTTNVSIPARAIITVVMPLLMLSSMACRSNLNVKEPSQLEKEPIQLEDDSNLTETMKVNILSFEHPDSTGKAVLDHLAQLSIPYAEYKIDMAHASRLLLNERDFEPRHGPSGYGIPLTVIQQQELKKLPNISVDIDYKGQLQITNNEATTAAFISDNYLNQPHNFSKSEIRRLERGFKLDLTPHLSETSKKLRLDAHIQVLFNPPESPNRTIPKPKDVILAKIDIDRTFALDHQTGRLFLIPQTYNVPAVGILITLSSDDSPN
jgi:hypothetical protein